MTFRIGNQLGTVLRLHGERATARQAERRAIKQMLDALAIGDRALATDRFALAAEWNALGASLESCLRMLHKPGTLVFATDAWYLRDLQRKLTPKRDEDAVYVTGPTIEGVRVLSRTCEFDLDERSPVYARGNSQSCLASLLRILDNGNDMHAIAHSHPGSGASATQQSNIDMGHLCGIQRAGAKTIGVIFTRDGFLRFFTYNTPFVVHVTGKGVVRVQENVYRLDEVGQV